MYLRIAALRILAPLLLAAAGSVHAAAQSIKVSEAQLKALDIGLADVQRAVTETRAVLPGTIIAPTNTRLAIPAPFTGTVTSLNVLPGQRLSKQQEVVSIASRDYIEALSKLEQARVEVKVAELTEKRLRSLVSSSAAPTRELEAAIAAREKAQLMLEQSSRTLSLGSSRTNSDGSYTILAPADGHVVETRVQAGSSLEAMAPTIVLDTTDDVWVQVQLPAALLGKVKQGDTVVVEGKEEGRVIAVSTDLDPVTRSTVLIATLHDSKRFAPGQMVSVTVRRPGAEGLLSVPSRSIAWRGSESFVFARTADGFERVKVNVTSRGAEAVTIESDLQPGRQVAARGLVQLEKLSD
jgi:cobalt-zinc-cadmium efflux system membrane fusion protein